MDQPISGGDFVFKDNTVSEAKPEEKTGLQNGDSILSAVSFAASVFLESSNWQDAIDVVLERLGTSAKANRAYLFENEIRDSDGEVLTSQRAEWVAAGISPQIGNPDLQQLPIREAGLERWLTIMNRRQPVFGLISTFPDSEREIFEAQEIQSLVAMPVFSQNRLWGLLGFDDCESLRTWSLAELDALSAAATALGAAIDRQHLESQLRFAQKMDAVGCLAAGVAHDFNNMLQIISGFTSIAKTKLPDGVPAHADLDQVLASTDRAHDLTRQLLSFARKQTLNPTHVQLNELCESVIMMLKPSLGGHIDLTANLATPSPVVFADGGLMSQVLVNLCLNARDAMPSGGRLTLTCEKRSVSEDALKQCPVDRAGDYAMLSVADNGCGMTPEIADRIFEPFFTTKDKLRTGLGLSVAFGTIQQSGGFIDVKSEPNQGSDFRIFLPLSDHHATTDHSPLGGSGEKAIVLLVDDEPLVLKSLGRLIESCGHSVLTAENANRALELIECSSVAIDVVLTDYKMPEMDGISLIQEIRKTNFQMKAILMSGYGSAETKLAEHFADVPFIQKPIQQEHLCLTIRNLLAKKKREEHST